MPRQDLLWLFRSDRLDTVVMRGAARCDGEFDWTHESPLRLQRLNRWLIRHIRLHPDKLEPLLGPLWMTFRGLAHARLRRGCRTLSQGRVVVTERLHGHIMCVLLGIPHVVFDTWHGKVKALYETWTTPCAFAQWGEDASDALEKARRMLRELPQ